ncbi:MAG: Verru_Chthon cassette protein C [Proteobacteria bacterium]|nr:Verru_Chthon cassette protein C [Pseudomonadota bacterium]
MVNPPARKSSPVKHSQNGFTLVEVLISTAILAFIVFLLLVMVSQMSKTWKSTSGKIEEFRAARESLDTITRRLSQATLNTYLDYDNPTNPTSIFRQSELRFLSGPTATILAGLGSTLTNTNPTMSVFFQAPNGFATNATNSVLQHALNTWGYFIEYGSDTNSRPSFLTIGTPLPRVRYRLMELMEPTESLSIYNYTTNRSYKNVDWISNSLVTANPRPSHVVAENVIALILLPKLTPADMGSTYTAASLAPDYVYDSSTTNSLSTNGMLNPHNQLPPVVQVSLIAVDEVSAVRFPQILANLSNVISSSNWFAQSTNFTADISAFQNYLSTKQINYRVFTTDIAIKAAKWSGTQTN